MLLSDSTGTAQLDLQAKPIDQAQLEVQIVLFGLFEAYLPDRDPDAVLDELFKGCTTGGERVRELMKQMTAGNQADWLVAAIAALLLLEASESAVKQGRREEAWSHAATASAWINYARGIACLGSALAEEVAARSKVATDAQWDTAKKVRHEAQRVFVERCPPGLWPNFEVAATTILPMVEKFGEPLGWKSKDKKVRVWDWLRGMPDASKYVQAKPEPKLKPKEQHDGSNGLFNHKWFGK